MSRFNFLAHVTMERTCFPAPESSNRHTKNMGGALQLRYHNPSGSSYQPITDFAEQIVVTTEETGYLRCRAQQAKPRKGKTEGKAPASKTPIRPQKLAGKAHLKNYFCITLTAKALSILCTHHGCWHESPPPPLSSPPTLSYLTPPHPPSLSPPTPAVSA